MIHNNLKEDFSGIDIKNLEQVYKNNPNFPKPQLEDGTWMAFKEYLSLIADYWDKCVEKDKIKKFNNNGEIYYE